MAKSKIKKTLIPFIIAIFVFSPIRFDSTLSLNKSYAYFIQPAHFNNENYKIIDNSETWHKSDDLSFEKPVVVTDNATLTIEAGTDIKLNGGLFYIQNGRIIAKGTQDEYVNFSSDNIPFSLVFENTNQNLDPSFLRYVKIENGGINLENPPVFAKYNSKHFLNIALAQEFSSMPAFQYFSGKIHIENSKFKNNKRADIAVISPTPSGLGEYLEVVNSNFESNQQNIALVSNLNCSSGCEERLLLKNNWFGHIEGPTTELSIQKGEIIQGGYYLDGWKHNDLIVDPVIIIPGVMGSQQFLGEWKIDPITHIYDDLINSFEENGYFKNKNLFKFPYQWRDSNKISALNLQGKIEGVINQTKVSKVDLVAHSMGGLIARGYVEEIEGTIYEDTIDQLITLGTPHRGSPEAYLKWEAGEGFDGIVEKLIKHHFKNEAKHYNYDNLYEYIQEKVISIKELLPDYNYLYDVSEEDMREYHENYPRNTFLEELNDGLYLEKLNSVELINVIGNDNTDNTISKIRVVDSTAENRWEHGMPENFYDNKTDRGLEYGEGDETVPDFSAQDIISDKTIKINSSHRELPTKAQCKILEELAQIDEVNCEYIDNIYIPNILLFNVFSPVDIKVITPDGAEIGSGVDDYEGDAFYSKYRLDNGEEIEFLTIPNPQDGEYKILTQGTDNGEYKIEVAKIAEDEATGEIIESTVFMEGIAELNKTGELKVKIQDNEVIKESRDTAPPIITITSPQNKTYLNDQILDIEFEVEDNQTKPENIQTEIYLDNQILESKNIDLALRSLGEHKIKIIARDEAGNQSEETIIFQTNTSLDSLIENIKHYYELGLIKSQGTEKILIKAVKKLKKAEKLIQKIQNHKKIPKNKKNKIIKFVQKRINYYINRIIKYINRKPDKLIKPRAKELLVESLGQVKY